MKLKKAILAVMDRDRLRQAMDAMELDGADRRSRDEMAAALGRARRATPEELLEYLSEEQVKAVCELVGVEDTGRRSKLIERLVRRERRLRRLAAAATGEGGDQRDDFDDDEASEAAELGANYDESDDDASNTGQAEMVGLAALGPPYDDAGRDGTDGSGDMDEAAPAAEEEANLLRLAVAESPREPVRLPETPRGMMRVTKTELVWPGKYNDDGTLAEVPRVSLPFQVIERVHESRATRQARKDRGATFFDIWERGEGDTFETGWRNKLIWGDNLLVMSSLLEQFAGKIDLIYIDPPFATGADFGFTAPIGDGEIEIAKEQSLIEEKAYRDTWGGGTASYLAMMYQRLAIIKELLSPTGTLYVHIDWTVGHYLKLVLDSLFGRDNFRNEVIWFYTNKLGTGGNTFDKHHDNLLVYVNGARWTHNALMRPVKNQKMQPVTQKIQGSRLAQG